MAAPTIQINLFDLTVFNPQITEPIVGAVGPATKGPVNVLTEFTDVGTFQNFHGLPANANHYGPRGFIRYLERGSNGRYVRVAGPNASAATLTLRSALLQDILRFTASSLGTWARDLSVSITHNGTTSYNVFVYFRGQLVERYIAMDNGIVVSRINGTSTRVTIELIAGAGATFPAETINPVTQALEKVPLMGGNDGALATSDSTSSTTSGVAGRRFHGKLDATAGSRVFENIRTIDADIAGKAEIHGTVGMAVVPGSFTIRVEVAAATYVELSDNGEEGYALGGAGLTYLIPAAGAHRGYIDYRTGEWGVQLDSATAFAAGSIDGIWIRANSESAGATVKGLEEYAGNLSVQNGVGVGYFNSNKFVLTLPIDMSTGRPPGASPAGAASSDADLQTLPGWVVPGTVVLTPTTSTGATLPPPIYDDGFGGFRTGPRGLGVPVAGATINYRTGAWAVPTWDPVGAVTFTVDPSALGDDVTIRALCDILIFDMGGGSLPGPNGTQVTAAVIDSSAIGGATADNADTNAKTIDVPILPGSVRLQATLTTGGVTFFYDDGTGAWLDRPRGDPRAAAVGGASAIDYDSGTWTLDLTAFGDTIVATSVVQVDYTSVAQDKALRHLRGTGPLFRADTTPDTSGLDLAIPTTDDDQRGTNFLDHQTGQFGIKLSLVETGDRTFDLADNGAIQVVYVAASIMGFGDGTTTVFPAQLAPTPFRREDDRVLAFQGAQASAAGAGDPQVSFGTLGVTTADDFWQQNVALPGDPDNFLVFATGQTSIQWTGAPSRDEAVYSVAEEVVIHFEHKFPGDIGNERPVLSDGFWIDVGADPTLAGTLVARIWFGATLVESFGQAVTLDELADAINDPNTGSALVTALPTDASTFLPVDVTAFQTVGLAGAFTIGDVIGTKVGQVYTGLQLFRNFETVDVDFIMIPGQWHRQVIIALQELCEIPGRRCIGIIPVPDADDPLKHRNFYNGNWGATTVGGIAVADVIVPFPPLVEIDSNLMVTIAPWVQNFDAINEVNKFEPPEGELARLISRTPHAWFPVAGTRRGQVTVQSLRYSASKEDRDLVMGQVGNRVEIVNLIARKSGRGLFLQEQATATRRLGALSRLSVRWTMNLIMNLIDLVATDFQFEINDPILWREATATLNRLLQPIIERRGLQDAHVVIDGTTVKPENIDALQMPGQIFVKPSLDVRDILFDLILTPQGADFSEIVVG